MKIHFHELARDDLQEAMAWCLTRQRFQMARRIWIFWNEGIDKIVEDPLRFPLSEDGPIHPKIRYWMFPKYGYRIIFQIVNYEIFVLALVRGRRLSNFWTTRIETK